MTMAIRERHTQVLASQLPTSSYLLTENVERKDLQHYECIMCFYKYTRPMYTNAYIKGSSLI